MIDLLSSTPHYRAHLLPLWDALPAEIRGQRFDVDGPSARAPWSVEDPTGAVLVASYRDLKTAQSMGYRRIALAEHGVGQSYSNGHPCYPGGRDRDAVGLFLSPNETAAGMDRVAYPSARVEVIGDPGLDALPALEGPSGVAAISFHWECFPGDALVSGPPVVAATARWFKGELVVIRTATGNEMACTPNHPVLTPEGWVASGSIDEGGYLIRRRARERMMLGDNPDDHDVPARIEDVARAVLQSRAMLAIPVPVAPEDFHGDGLDSEVAVVATNRPLRNDPHHSALAEPLGEADLLGLGLRSAELARESLLPERLLRVGVPCTSGSGSTCQRGSLKLRQGSHPTAHRDGPGYVDSRLLEPSVNGGSIDAVLQRQFSRGGAISVAFNEWTDRRAGGPVAEARGLASGAEQASATEILGDLPDRETALASDLLGGSAGEVFADQVVEVRRRDFEGYVYNLQTSASWYEANGYIVHNCRVAPETRSAFPYYRSVIVDLAKAVPLIGHAHPRAAGEMARFYRRIGVEFVPTFDEVCRRASVFVADNTSCLFEFASTGRPVVVLNQPTYRRDFHPGLRFWDAANVGVQVDEPGDLVAGVEKALLDSPEQQANRDAALRLAYSSLTGAAQRGAAILAEWAA